MPADLTITGSVRIDGAPLVGDLEAHFLGKRVVIDLDEMPKAPASRGGAETGGSPSQDRKRHIEQLDAFLRRTGFDAELRIAGTLVARMGPNAKPTLSASLLGLGPIELHGMQALKIWLGM